MNVRTIVHLLALMAFSASAVLVQVQARRQPALGEIKAPWRPIQLLQASLALFFVSLALLDQFDPGLMSLAGLFASLLTLMGVFLFLRDFFGYKKMALPYFILGALALGLYIAHFWLPLVMVGGTLIQFGSIVHLGICARLGRSTLSAKLGPNKDALLFRVLKDCGIASAVCLPFLLLDPLGTQLGWSALGFLIDNYSLPVFCIIINSILAVRIVGALDAAASGQTQTPADEGRGSSAIQPTEPKPDELFDRLRAKLSAREFEVAALLLEGKSAKDIAQVLDLSTKTVENHTSTLYRKLGVKSRYEFISKNW